MEFGPDGSLLLPTALSMSCVSEADGSADAAEVARLVRLTLGGDATAFEPIIRRYEMRVMSLAVRLLGERDAARDVAQDVFLRAFKYLHRADPGRPFEPWLLRIAVNVCRDAARASARRRTRFVEGCEVDPVDRSSDPHADLERKGQRLLLQRALALLPEKERFAVVLRDIEGLSTADVAAILHSSETTVRSQVSRGRLRLKAAIARATGGQS